MPKIGFPFFGRQQRAPGVIAFAGRGQAPPARDPGGGPGAWRGPAPRAQLTGTMVAWSKRRALFLALKQASRRDGAEGRSFGAGSA